MTTPVQTLRPEDTLSYAAKLMRDHAIGCLPVVGDSGMLAGILTDRDIALSADEFGEALWKLRVVDSMHHRVWTCHANDGIEQAAKSMRDHRVRRLPVVDAAGTLVGLVSLDDLAHASRQPVIDDAEPDHRRARRHLRRDVRSEQTRSGGTAMRQSGDRGVDTLIGFLVRGSTVLEGFLAEARQLAKEQLLGGARAQFARFANRLDRHMRLQEHLVYPAGNEHCASSLTVASFEKDHEDLRALVAEGEAALDREDARAFTNVTETLSGRLHRHHEKERPVLEALVSDAS